MSQRRTACRSSSSCGFARVAQTQLAPMIPGARACYAQRRALQRRFRASLTLGQIVTLNANGDSAHPCTNPINISARVAAISNTAIVVADTANPTGGFTDAEYASFATTFDTLISPLDVQNFGAADGHRQERQDRHLLHEGSEQAHAARQRRRGRRLLLRARSLPDDDHARLAGLRGEQLRARCSTCSCPTRRAMYSDARTKQTCSASRRHARARVPASDQRRPPPLRQQRRRLRGGVAQRRTEPHRRGAAVLHGRRVSRRGRTSTSARSGATPASVDAFNNYQGDNFGRFEIFLGKPSQTSVVRGQRRPRDARRDVVPAALSRRPSRLVRRRHVDAAREQRRRPASTISRTCSARTT